MRTERSEVVVLSPDTRTIVKDRRNPLGVRKMKKGKKKCCKERGFPGIPGSRGYDGEPFAHIQRTSTHAFLTESQNAALWLPCPAVQPGKLGRKGVDGNAEHPGVYGNAGRPGQHKTGAGW
uniref:Collagen alpha-1(I) chain-like n=1 Tax=Angiostrongylus cantonensis TaxID=6313 RepID=A0A0K0D6Y2_ANGCA